ncbi:hypothetical protein FBU30_007501 [Linnemannia zychae]|nr:hypothetical protein FBU30_007501 [Linnemannia zychae]
MAIRYNEDVLITLFRYHNSPQGNSALVTIGGARQLRITWSFLHDSVEIKTTGEKERNPFGGFKYLSILDGRDKILTLNQISDNTRSTAPSFPSERICDDQGYIFKILLTATSTLLKPKPGTKYVSTSSVMHCFEEEAMPRSPHSTSFGFQAYQINNAFSMENANCDYPSSPDSVSTEHSLEAIYDHRTRRHSYPPTAAVEDIPCPDARIHHASQNKGIRVINLIDFPEFLKRINVSQSAISEMLTIMEAVKYYSDSQNSVAISIPGASLMVLNNTIGSSNAQNYIRRAGSPLSMTNDLNAPYRGNPHSCSVPQFGGMRL